MHATPAHAALDAVQHAIALFTYELGVLPDDAPLTRLRDRIGALQRALSRVDILTTMHPDLTAADALPRGSMPADELTELLAQETELERIVTAEPTPTTVTLTVRSLPPSAPEDVRDIAAHLRGAVLPITQGSGADDGAYVIDIGAVLAHAVLTATTDDDWEGQDYSWLDEQDPDER